MWIALCVVFVVALFYSFSSYVPFVLPSAIALGHVLFKDWRNYDPKWFRWPLLIAILAAGFGGVVYQSRQLAEKASAAVNSRILEGKVQASLDVQKTNAQEFTKLISALFTEIADLKTKAATDPLQRSIAGLEVEVKANTTAVRDISEPKGVTNSQLKEAAQDLARRLRDFQVQISTENVRFWEVHRRRSIEAIRLGDKAAQDKAFSETSSETLKLSSKQRASFGSLRAEAIHLRAQLLSRLPTQPVNRLVESTLDSGLLAGPNPASAVADYLEVLALKLAVR